MDSATIMICNMQYVMGSANAICNANMLWAARMRYAICEYAIGRANAICEYPRGRVNVICDMRIRYRPRECDMRYANTLGAVRMQYAIRE